ncbi:hypothetical protein H9P43_006720 [Blastocladiella emersonii ATCC 22665]|nr:hypothetical protein H9P43_006720 [Blastocladiella emersonii ATCC 22665]
MHQQTAAPQSAASAPPAVPSPVSEKERLDGLLQQLMNLRLGAVRKSASSAAAVRPDHASQPRPSTPLCTPRTGLTRLDSTVEQVCGVYARLSPRSPTPTPTRDARSRSRSPVRSPSRSRPSTPHFGFDIPHSCPFPQPQSRSRSRSRSRSPPPARSPRPPSVAASPPKSSPSKSPLTRRLSASTFAFPPEPTLTSVTGRLALITFLDAVAQDSGPGNLARGLLGARSRMPFRAYSNVALFLRDGMDDMAARVTSLNVLTSLRQPVWFEAWHTLSRDVGKSVRAFAARFLTAAVPVVGEAEIAHLPQVKRVFVEMSLREVKACRAVMFAAEHAVCGFARLVELVEMQAAGDTECQFCARITHISAAHRTHRAEGCGRSANLLGIANRIKKGMAAASVVVAGRVVGDDERRADVERVLWELRAWCVLHGALAANPACVAAQYLDGCVMFEDAKLRAVWDHVCM